MQTVGIVGLGALGVLFGQRLLENGADVRVIADEARAERYQKQGIICNGTPVNFRYETPKTAKPVDLMIFATKESGLRGAMETASGFIGENTLMLSVLNGVSSEETIAARFGARNVIYCTAQVWRSTFHVTKGAYMGKNGITRDRTGKPWYYRNSKR